MTLGEKLRSARIERKMTQSELCDTIVTRNMLSKIENGAAMPSLDCIIALAARLNIPVGYFLSEDEDYTKYRHADAMNSMLTACRQKKYAAALDICKKLGDIDGDDVMKTIAGGCAYRAALDCWRNGELDSCRRYLGDAKNYLAASVIPPAPADSDIDALFRLCELTPEQLVGGMTDVSPLTKERSRQLFAGMGAPLAYPYAQLMRARDMLREGDSAGVPPLLEPVAQDEALDAAERNLAAALLERIYADNGDYERAYKMTQLRKKLIK